MRRIKTVKLKVFVRMRMKYAIIKTYCFKNRDEVLRNFILKFNMENESVKRMRIPLYQSMNEAGFSHLQSSE